MPTGDPWKRTTPMTFGASVRFALFFHGCLGEQLPEMAHGIFDEGAEGLAVVRFVRVHIIPNLPRTTRQGFPKIVNHQPAKQEDWLVKELWTFAIYLLVGVQQVRGCNYVMHGAFFCHQLLLVSCLSIYFFVGGEGNPSDLWGNCWAESDFGSFSFLGCRTCFFPKIAEAKFPQVLGWCLVESTLIFLGKWCLTQHTHTHLQCIFNCLYYLYMNIFIYTWYMPLKKINLHHKGMNHHETLKKWRLVEHHHFLM